MSATTTDVPATLVPLGRPQWQRVTRLVLGEAMRNVLWATGITLAVMTIAALIARWRGWEVIVARDMDSLTMQVTEDGDGVRVVWSLLIVAVAVAIAAIANQIVQVTRTKVFLASGATRGSVAVAMLITAAVMLLYVVAVTAVVVLIVGRGLDGAMSLIGADGGAELATMTVHFVGTLAAGLAAGPAIVALFQRWPTWVGVVILVALGLALPLFSGLTFGPRLESVIGWWGTDLVMAVVWAGVYWVVARRVPVR